MNNKSEKIIKAEVKFVFDGDTFEIKPINSEETIRIRLYGVDAPERGQEYGGIAQYLMQEKLLKLKTPIDVRLMNSSHKDRQIAMVWINGKNLNLDLVKNGLAWKSLGDQDEYATSFIDAQIDAQVNKNGLWSRHKPEEPYKYRNRINLQEEGHYKAAVERDRIEVQKYKSGLLFDETQRSPRYTTAPATNNGAGWYDPKQKDIKPLVEMVKEKLKQIKELFIVKDLKQSQQSESSPIKEISVDEAMRNLRRKNKNRP